MDTTDRSGPPSRNGIRAGRRSALLSAALVPAFCFALAGPAAASHDPNRTATIYVHGFDPDGAVRHGVYGDDIHKGMADSVASLVGVPVSPASLGPLPVNVVAATTYYGDNAPSYYSPEDVAEIAEVTAQWGGGVPRYALIVAKFARSILERSGADQVNFVSVSFGSLIVRWLIEKDVEGLAGSGKIARWLSVEGVVDGNWAASHQDLVDILSVFDPQPIDVEHMSYDWIAANLHAPRAEADDPVYAGILLGQVGSTDDGGTGAALRTAMLAYKDYQPNDGIQGLSDARLQDVALSARLAGLPPTEAVFHSDHLGLQQWRSAWAEAATFLTSSRRVTVTITRAQVWNLHEVALPFWDWRPAEVLFESRVYSPAAEKRWAVTQPLCAYVKEGAAMPLRLYARAGDTHPFEQVIFDDLVLPEEQELSIELRAVDVDYDPRYGVLETLETPYYDDMGGGTVRVSTLEPGTYQFAVPDWNCTLSVTVYDYPFAQLTGVAPHVAVRAGGALSISPNPFASLVRIAAPVSNLDPPGETATLEIADVTGRVVRRMQGALGTGFVWDGRGDGGRLLPAGVYLHHLVTPRGAWNGRSCLLR